MSAPIINLDSYATADAAAKAIQEAFNEFKITREEALDLLQKAYKTLPVGGGK